MHTNPFPIVGAHFRPPAKALLGVLPSGFKGLRLRAEPSNPFDSNAVQVLLCSDELPHELAPRISDACLPFGFDSAAIYEQAEWHLGYIPKGIAAIVQPQITSDIRGELSFDAFGKPFVSVTLTEG